MKKIIALLLALALCVSMCACAPQRTPEEQKQYALDTLKAYVVENGETASNNDSVLILDSGIADVTMSIWANDAEMYMKLDYAPAKLQTNVMSTTYTTAFYFYGAPPQKEGQYFVMKWNDAKVNGSELSWYGYVDINPADFTVDTPIVFSDSFRSDGVRNVVNDTLVEGTHDGIHTVLEVFSNFLSESGLKLTLSDFGFQNYTIDSTRESDTRNGTW